MQVQAFLLLRKLHVKLNHGNVEEEEALLADLCAPTASVERGSSINLAKHAWFPATVSSPAAQGGGETGAGPSGKLKRVALVLGQSFLVRECDCFVAACVCVCVCVAVCVCVCVAVAADVCVTKVVAEIDNKPSNGPTGIAKLVVPMHHIQSLTDPRSAHVLHLRVWSAKPVLFATCVCCVLACLPLRFVPCVRAVADACVCCGRRDPSSVEGASSDHTICVWTMSVVLDTPDFCAHLHNHVTRYLACPHHVMVAPHAHLYFVCVCACGCGGALSSACNRVLSEKVLLLEDLVRDSSGEDDSDHRDRRASVLAAIAGSEVRPDAE